MKELLFKTNIKCNGCIAKVTPFLNGEKQIEEWDVNLENPDRVLSIKTESFSAEAVTELVKKAGYNAEEIK
ncbi:MAG: heavy-metal-associated domain-containing protein [Ignavibacteriaceae bacterium]|jgi:copper chaperone CopZ|nr:heavy-metal-associated domain-containing protein [Ignavibacteriaceae bacterium]